MKLIIPAVKECTSFQVVTVVFQRRLASLKATEFRRQCRSESRKSYLSLLQSVVLILRAFGARRGARRGMKRELGKLLTLLLPL